jgi:hypothetical protein
MVRVGWSSTKGAEMNVNKTGNDNAMQYQYDAAAAQKKKAEQAQQDQQKQAQAAQEAQKDNDRKQGGTHTGGEISLLA